ncbi:MAG: TrmO family methyltransferase [Candidatus Hydrothermarchaeales archaeon]
MTGANNSFKFAPISCQNLRSSVFSTRSSKKPNPIEISVVNVFKIDGILYLNTIE